MTRMIDQRNQPRTSRRTEEAPIRHAPFSGPAPLLTAPLLSAAFLWAAYYPLSWGWTAWFALVPLLTLVKRSAGGWRLYGSAWLCGLAFFWPVLQWMRVADARMYATWAMLSTYCSLYFPLAVYLLRKLDGNYHPPLALGLPAVWVALEFLRAHLMTGFAWYFLGHSQHEFLSLIQVADLGGVYAVSFVVAAVNGLLFDLLFSTQRFRSWFALNEVKTVSSKRRLVCESAAVAALALGAILYGSLRLSGASFEKGPRIALLQGNIDQRLRNRAASGDGSDEALHMIRHYVALADEAARSPDAPQLVVWPETSQPDYWIERPEGAPDKYSEDLAYHLARRVQADILLGMNVQVRESDDRHRLYNSAVFATKAGQFAGRYDKMHRVPFGEYVPLRESLPWMNAFAPYDFDYSIRAGERFTRFVTGEHRFGVLICYEDTDADLARAYVRPGADESPVDFLVNISNDGWFDGTSEHEQHLAICRFRAIECRRALARSVNMGISAVIDGNGVVVALPGPTLERSKRISGLVAADIPLDRRSSFYARFGDWMPWGCWIFLAAGLAGLPFRKESA